MELPYIKLLIAGISIFVLCRLGYWYWQGRKLKQSGYMPPASPKIARATFKGFCAVVARIAVGPITVLGKANAIFTGRGIVLPNHTIWPDFAVIGKAIPFSYRQIAKYAEIKFAPIRTIAAWIGTVGVQVDGGKSKDGAGKAIVDAGANILAASYGSRLLVFSQGKLVYSGECNSCDFRTGSTRMLFQAEEQIGDEPLSGLPVAIYYKRDKSEATLFQRIAYPLGLKFFRTRKWVEVTTDAAGNEIKTTHKFVVYGAVVCIGEHIPVDKLSDDPREAIEQIRQSIAANLEIAAAHSRGKRAVAA